MFSLSLPLIFLWFYFWDLIRLHCHFPSLLLVSFLNFIWSFSYFSREGISLSFRFWRHSSAHFEAEFLVETKHLLPSCFGRLSYFRLRTFWRKITSEYYLSEVTVDRLMVGHLLPAYLPVRFYLVRIFDRQPSRFHWVGSRLIDTIVTFVLVLETLATFWGWFLWWVRDWDHVPPILLLFVSSGLLLIECCLICLWDS